MFHTLVSSRWTYLLVLACFRVGEAANPGPDCHNFVLGAFNPSGLRDKAPYIVSHLAHGDIWAVSETHLCSQAILAFRSSIHFASGPFGYCVGGHPVPAQQNRTHHAAWRGVATLSKHPTRHVPTNIPPELLESSRIMVTTSLVHDVWVTGGVVYGEPESSTYPHQEAHNEVLLHHAASHVCNLARGPRYLAGDWNVSQHSLPAFDLLETAGFVELQDIACAKWGLPIHNTCKQATRKDFCYVSRELATLLIDVRVEHDIFPDHAVLFGVFRCLSNVSPRFVWPCPQQFPWPANWVVNPNCWNDTTGTADSRYWAVWQHIENQACDAIPFPVHKAFKGRAATQNTKPVHEAKISPPKKARRGDLQPHFLCASFRHAQWLRQSRRLQSYVRFVGANCSLALHARRLWGAIVRSTGFSPDFPTWWSTCSFRTHGAPCQIPLCPPEVGTAVSILDSFVLAFRAMERDLQKASRLYARQRREANPNIMFQDLKPYQTSGVDILLKNMPAQVVEVRQEDNLLVLDRPMRFDVERPVMCHGQPLEVIHADTDGVWVTCTDHILPGHVVSQESRLGTTTDLFDHFLSTWKTMWERHANVPADRWTEILQFARRFLPRHTPDWRCMQPADLAQCILHKRPATSAGLDGVTLQDLKALPDAALRNFTDMFHFAETTGSWPTQVVAGRVTCLAKKPAPGDALDFRPITVLGLLYRCWGKFHARQAIKFLEPLLPPGLFGSRPRCYAGQIWSQLLWSIEMAYETNVPLSGIIADIQKAFNCLPREVVFESCALVGIPFPILKAWAGALTAMPRRFQINGSLSPPAFSTCGLPEGCAFSCVGMMVIDMLFHSWMTHFFPLCQPLSYVDDWQILLHSAVHIDGVFDCLERFTHALDLQLDHRKTHMWSTCSTSRGILRDQGFKLTSGGRNLGAHVQFSRQHTNKSLMERVQSVTAIWPKLRMSACSYKQKVRALTCAAWPRALHGVAATTLSHAAFGALRSGAMKGLHMDAAGANPAVQLGLIEKTCTDPLAWAIMQTLRLARDCGQKFRVEQVLADLVGGSDAFPANSITSTLLTRIQCLGWHIDAGGRIHDIIGPFSLFDISAVEIQFRIECQWPLLVAAEVNHRSNFSGLEFADPDDVHKFLAALDVSDQALFRKVLNGTHITQDGKSHCQGASDDVCPFCECSDSRFHRFWQCEQFDYIRSKVPLEVRQAALVLPAALTCSGWSLAPSTRLDWYQHFANLEELPVPQHDLLGEAHIFTDGSCQNQKYPTLRFAGWAVILASTSSLGNLSHSEVLDAGVLPGLLQSAVRAEIYAVWRALLLSRDHPGLVHIWTDCDAVVKKFRRLLAGSAVKVNSLHADLWGEIHQCLLDRAGPTCITRVAAHQCVETASTAFHEWCFRHNALADKHANQVNLARDEGFWCLYQRHLTATEGIAFVKP